MADQPDGGVVVTKKNERILAAQSDAEVLTRVVAMALAEGWSVEVIAPCSLRLHQGQHAATVAIFWDSGTCCVLTLAVEMGEIQLLRMPLSLASLPAVLAVDLDALTATLTDALAVFAGAVLDGPAKSIEAA